MKVPIQRYGTFSGISMVLLLFAMQLGAQISPGALSEPHAHLEGLSNCTKCHILGEKVSNDKCLSCHTEISTRINEGRGYHASKEVNGKECAKCHNEHHGRKFQMTRFDTDNFDHTITGYKLEGSHAGKVCKTCHKSEFITDRKLKEKSSTYLGLDQKCIACHADSHQGSLSDDCASCHDFTVFKPAGKFDHNRARFKLLGKHAEADCYACHKLSVDKGKEIRQFTGLSFGKCTSCHKDVHANKFGQNCTQCHSEVSFHQIKGMKNFNHARTNYPLVDKHRLVACKSCHKKGYTAKIKHNLCSDCHSDYHRKQFAVQGKSPDCSSCHSTLGFKQSKYTIERHNETHFQLAGAHLATPCFDCHKKTDKWSFRDIGIKCIDCHKNSHASLMDKKYYAEDACESCHSVSSWSDIAFDHSKTGYILEGAHKKQSCRSCHIKTGAQGVQVQQFSQLSADCLNCHKDNHQKQFEDSAGTTGSSCLKCHNFFDWKAGLFNHNQTAFPLDGKHKDVACVKCHPPTITAQVTYTLYKLKSYKCESCH